MHEELIVEFRNGNRRAGDDFYKANLKLIGFAVNRFKNLGLEREEVEALVNQSFAFCMKEFKLNSFAFSTFFYDSSKKHSFDLC